jgi:hypothetical protein
MDDARPVKDDRLADPSLSKLTPRLPVIKKRSFRPRLQGALRQLFEASALPQPGSFTGTHHGTRSLEQM